MFTSNGLNPDLLKTAAIIELPVPTDVTSLQRFLGMVNYLGKFIPSLNKLSASLRQLTRKDNAWSWYPQHQRAFETLKLQLASAPTLAYFNLNLPITITCDTSQYGLDAACLQTAGDVMPVSTASRTIIHTEQHYAQIEKDLLTVVFACSKLKDFIFGKTFTVETDHLPLVTILNKPIHVAPARLQRMMMHLHRIQER